MADKKILDLAQIRSNRPVVKFDDGREYEMRHPDELSLNKLMDLKVAGEKIVSESNNISGPDGTAAFNKAMLEAFKLIFVDCPDETILSLTPVAAGRVMDFFMEQFPKRAREEAMAMVTATGEEPSPSSSDSTEEPPKDG